MTQGNQQEWPNVAMVTEEARAQWERQFRKTMSIQERIGDSVPWWLVLIALGLFLLSMPHTAVVFEMLTPSIGYIAPIVVEFGLLFSSFRRKQNKMTGILRSLEWLLFVVAVIVNGAGSFKAVVEATESVQGLSFMALYKTFGDLPATSQVALLLAPAAALIIPVGTVVAGEGLAALVLERREAGNALEMQWQQDKAMVIFEALRNAAIANGITPGRAQKWAESIAFYERSETGGQVSVKRERTANGQQRTPKLDTTSGQRDPYASERVWAHLRENPDDADLSARKLADVVGVGKTVSANVLSEFKAARNGHSDGGTPAGEE